MFARNGRGCIGVDDPMNERIEIAKLRLEAIDKAKTDLIEFAKLMKPVAGNEADPRLSTYETARHHVYLAKKLEQVASGEIRRLIVNMPPRSGKTEMSSKLFPAWMAGRFPERSLILSTYNERFSYDFGRAVRNFMKSPAYKQIFPNAKPKKGAMSANRLEMQGGGLLVFTGVGGSLTGRGGHCFPAETRVYTTNGPKEIGQLTTLDQVLSYDTRRNEAVFARVEAIIRRPKTGLLRITTASGRVVEATPDHPFYVEGRWVKARQLAPGDLLLRSLWDGGAKDGLRDQQTHQKRSLQSVLLGGLREARSQCQALWGEALRAVRSFSAQSNKQRNAKGRSDILFGGMSFAGQGRGNGPARFATDETLRAVQRDVCPREQRHSVLFEDMQRQSALSAYVRKIKSALEGWGCTATQQAAYSAKVSGNATARYEAGWEPLRSLLGNFALGSASHRREPTEQRGIQSGDGVQAVPREGSLFGCERDAVISVEDTCRTADVFDIQVEETHCFFAEGILAHNCIIADDLIKDRQQADSQLERDKMWAWWNTVLKTRLMDDRSSMMIITTRWHEDDVVGRLTDPTNSYYDPDEAAMWEVIDLPAFAVDDDPLGRKPGEVLWPSRFGVDFLENMRRGDPRGFSALYQCRPSPEDGAFFQVDWLQEYKPAQLPANLRYYIATDFAVSSSSNRDKTCIMPVGIDERQNIYVLPDVWWHHGTSEQVVEAFVNLVAKYRPLMVWGEKGQIAKSLGPFIRKRMAERGAFAPIDETHPTVDKQARAASISGRMAMGKVFFPIYAPWWAAAKDQLLKFPQSSHDDFVDALSLIGMGLMKLHVPKGQREVQQSDRPGTFGWLKQQTERKTRMISMASSSEGW